MEGSTHRYRMPGDICHHLSAESAGDVEDEAVSSVNTELGKGARILAPFYTTQVVLLQQAHSTSNVLKRNRFTHNSINMLIQIRPALPLLPSVPALFQ